MKAIKRIMISLVVIVAVLGVAVIGGYIYVRSAYGIDLFRIDYCFRIVCI